MKKLATTILTVVAISAPVMGEDPKAQLDFEAAQPGSPVLVSGIKHGGVYDQLPPVLVEFTGLNRSAEVWVEVRSDADADAASKRGKILADAKKIVWMDDIAVLNVPGLEKVCKGTGTWTLVVMQKEGPAPTVMARTTFKLDRSAQVAGGRRADRDPL